MYLALAHGEMRLTPGEVDGMTPAEVALCLDRPRDGETRAPEGMRAMSSAEMADAARRRRETPLAERVARARRGL